MMKKCKCRKQTSYRHAYTEDALVEVCTSCNGKKSTMIIEKQCRCQMYRDTLIEIVDFLKDDHPLMAEGIGHILFQANGEDAIKQLDRMIQNKTKGRPIKN